MPLKFTHFFVFCRTSKLTVDEGGASGENDIKCFTKSRKQTTQTNTHSFAFMFRCSLGVATPPKHLF